MTSLNMEEVYREITPRKTDQLFFTKFTRNDPMDFPFHSHDDFELTLCLDVQGNRIVGSQVDKINGIDLVLIAPDVMHGYKWNDDFCGCDVAVIQFSRDSVGYPVFNSGVLKPIGEMLSKVKYGMRFSETTALELKDKIVALHKTEGLAGFHLFIDILYALALSKESVALSAVQLLTPNTHVESKRVTMIMKYVSDNYMRKITLVEIAELVRMQPSSVCRYFKQKTKMNFWEYLNNYRIDQACMMILNTDDYISEICYSCGFNNISNFNRSFKKRIGMSPSEYRAMMNESIITLSEH